MGQRDVLVLSLGQSNFFLDTSLSFLVLCTLLMVSFMWLHYNHFIPSSYTVMKCDFTVCLMMMNTNNDSDMSAVCFVCFCIHNHGALFIPFFHHYIQLHNNNIFEDDQRNLLMFTSITKTPSMFEMCSLAFRWLTSFLYYWTHCHKNKSEFEHIL